MSTYYPTVIIRHRLENLKKCSLKNLENRPDFLFITYPYTHLPDLSHYIILSLDAPPLTIEDADKGLLVIDATWRYASKMIKPFLSSRDNFSFRSLPSHYRTAYPRRQNDCIDPERGLASIEAIYLSYKILSREGTGLLDHYYWKETFLQINNL